MDQFRRDGAYARTWRPTPSPREDNRYPPLFALEERLDRAVHAVPHPARDAMALSLGLHGGPEGYALHSPLHQDPDGDQAHARTRGTMVYLVFASGHAE